MKSHWNNKGTRHPKLHYPIRESLKTNKQTDKHQKQKQKKNKSRNSGKDRQLPN